MWSFSPPLADTNRPAQSFKLLSVIWRSVDYRAYMEPTEGKPQTQHVKLTVPLPCDEVVTGHRDFQNQSSNQ